MYQWWEKFNADFSENNESLFHPVTFISIIFHLIIGWNLQKYKYENYNIFLLK